MKYIENIVLNNTPLDAFTLLSNGSILDWNMELERTLLTEERFLPRILVELGVTKSTSEIKRNRKDLFITLPIGQYNEFKLGKRKFFIVS